MRRGQKKTDSELYRPLQGYFLKC